VSHHIIELKGLSFRYPDGTPALDSIDLTIHHGESVGLVGANGAGKSTLLQHLCGVHVPQTGRVRVGDVPVVPGTLREVRRTVGLVFQDPDDQLFMPTVAEDVAFGPLNIGLPPEEAARRVDEALAQVNNFLELLPAAQRKSTVAKLHKGIQPLFHQYHVEKQIEQIYQPTVPLPSGGSIVINPTEALVAIDVNSGRTGKDKSFEDAIFLANMEAAEELSRQLRLRDLGGLIVVDFIDMRDSKHIREVEKKVRDCMKRDKAKVDFSKISKFGLMQISRQKMAAPVSVGSYRICPHCQGRGMVRSVETQALVHFRHIQTGVTRKEIKRVVCRLPMEVAHYILNKKRQDLMELEQEHQVEISIIPEATMPPNESKIDFLKE